MSSLVIAMFGNQFAAASAFDTLMSHGLRRRKDIVQCAESVDLSAGASAPTAVVSRLRHHSKRLKEKQAVRAPRTLPPPDELGMTILTVEIDDDSALEVVMEVMRSMNALDVHILPGAALREEDALPWPEPSGQNEDDWVDIERAIEAALRGKPRVH